MVDRFGVVGAGTMGVGIAQVAAMAGSDVVVFDMNPETLQKASVDLLATLNKLAAKGKISNEDAVAIFGRIHFSQSLGAMKECELVLEAIVENLDVKKTLFRELEAIVGDNTILATNTSSLSITAIAQSCKISDRVIGIHFFNPAPIMQLVEIIPASQTHDVIIQKVKKAIENWGKIVVLAKDSPGFVVNKIARPYYSEAIRMLDEGIGSCASIDHAMTFIGGFKMGPFTLMDLIGHDVNYAVTESVWKGFYYDTRYAPSATQKRMVEAGYLGKKSNKGFYTYENGAKLETELEADEQSDYVYKRILYMLINEAADTVFKHICTEEDADLAVRFGVNYPKGLLAWAEEIGYDEIVKFLDLLYNRYHEERYRVSPYLRDRTSLY